LGANQVEVLGLVLRQGMLVACIGIAAGLACALAGSRVLESLLFGLNDRDPFFVVAGVLAAISVSGCSIPAWRASRVDPMKALRDE
jgi:ABC-type antimicrobial peptide transport system permease subunit